MSSVAIPSLRQLFLQRVLDPGSFDENLNKIREAGLKRAHARGLDQFPPGFVGVRGRKSEKAKVKEPFPGFLGVRGKKSSDEESTSYYSRSNFMIPITRYFQKEYAKLKSDRHY